ncbi:hypothetical protein [Sporisorium scitamineum]|uniref:Uncharacterized protein n=1 Tax=Sporisorium scitamineum TaxID=49012 RepID=A0A0F7S6P4_9BASI|nr:hypothetical protein [Sporisorium scitamineum]
MAQKPNFAALAQLLGIGGQSTAFNGQQPQGTAAFGQAIPQLFGGVERVIVKELCAGMNEND